MFFLIPYIISFIAAGLSIHLTMSFFASKNHFPVSSRTVIITGGSQGLGLALGRLLSGKGANIVIVAQDRTKLDSAIDSIRAHASSPNSQRFLSLSYDLRSPSSAPEILSRVKEWNNGHAPDIVWCCAGNSHPAFFADASIESLRNQMDTNFWSAAYMAHATLNLWKTPRGSTAKLQNGSDQIPLDSQQQKNTKLQTRHLIFTGSVVSFFPLAGYTPYTTPKAAMKSLSDSIRQEIAVYNGAHATGSPSSPAAEMKVSIVYPAGILTPGFEYENSVKPELTKALEEGDKPQTAEEVAEIAVRKLEQGESSITTLFLGHLMRGCGMGATPRIGVVDVFWNWLGSLVVIFVSLDFISQCRKWGREKGVKTGV